MTLKEQVKQLALSHGMDLFGVAELKRFSDSPAGRHPCDILPGCKSVIVVGVRLLDGAIQSNFRAFEDGRNDLKGIYGTYGYSMLPNFSLSYACYAIAQFIERGTGCCTTPCSTGPMTNGVQLSVRHAAVAAGLGEFGWSGLVLTPEFGPRNRFGVILTRAELEPDPMYSGERLCNPAKCGICTRLCTTCALSKYGKGEPVRGKLGDYEFEYTSINRPKCQLATMAMRKEYGGREDYVATNDPTPEEVTRGQMAMPYTGAGLQNPANHNCGKCISYCPAGHWKEKFLDTGISRGAGSAENK